MPPNEIEETWFNEFYPDLEVSRSNAKSGNTRFVHYTTADTAMKILQSGEVWLRSAMMMNDHSEISYGLSQMYSAFKCQAGVDIIRNAEKMFPDQGVSLTIQAKLNDSQSFWKQQTYLACLSEHDSTEDGTGRLSMWRAYGDVALVVNGTPLAAETDQLGA